MGLRLWKVQEGLFCFIKFLTRFILLETHLSFGCKSLLLYKNLNHKRLGIYYLVSGFNLHFALAQPISSGTCVYRRMYMNIFISPSLLQASTGFNINLTCICARRGGS